jgi:hypothetical protein
MNKGTREIVQAAEVEGLKLVEIELGSRHVLLLFKNGQGNMMRYPVSKSGVLNYRDEQNARAQFRRFARGQHHGLNVKEKH